MRLTYYSFILVIAIQLFSCKNQKININNGLDLPIANTSWSDKTLGSKSKDYSTIIFKDKTCEVAIYNQNGRINIVKYNFDQNGSEIFLTPEGSKTKEVKVTIANENMIYLTYFDLKGQHSVAIPLYKIKE